MAVFGTASILVSCNKDDNNNQLSGDIPVFMVTLDGTAVELGVNIGTGEKAQLIAVVSPNGTKVKDVTWTSSSETVVSINPSGAECMITAKAIGNAVITVTSTEDATKSATCNVTVKWKKVLLDGMKLEFPAGDLVEGLLLMDIGDTKDLGPYLKLDPEYTTNENVTWSSSNDDAVSVTQEGVITVKLGGRTRITVSATEIKNRMGEDVEVEYSTYCDIHVAGLVYDYTAEDFDAFVPNDSYNVPGTINTNQDYWFGEPNTCFAEMVPAIGKMALNTNVRFLTGQTNKRFDFPKYLYKKTLRNCDRVEMDVLYPYDDIIGDDSPDHDHRLRLRCKYIDGINFDGVTNPNEGAYSKIYIATNGEVIGDNEFFKMTYTVDLTKDSRFIPYDFAYEGDDFNLQYGSWYFMTTQPIYISGLRFYANEL